MAPRLGLGLILVLLLGLGPPAMATHITGDATASPLKCGTISPFSNRCEVVKPFPMSPHPAPLFSVLGFVGTIDVSIKQANGQGGGEHHWRCSFAGGDWSSLGLPEPECTDWRVGHIEVPADPNGRGPDVQMRCVASGYEIQGIEILPDPFGSWGCGLTL